MPEASPFIQTIQKNTYRIASANACVLLGLYEGAYYSECLSFYNNLLVADPDLKHLPDPRGFFATILSAYKLHAYSQMVSVYSLVSTRNVWASREVVYAMTDVFLRGDFWKPAYQQRVKELGSPDASTQLQLLAQCRIPQLLQGARIMGDFCRRNKECCDAECERRFGGEGVYIRRRAETDAINRCVGGRERAFHDAGDGGSKSDCEDGEEGHRTGEAVAERAVPSDPMQCSCAHEDRLIV